MKNGLKHVWINVSCTPMHDDWLKSGKRQSLWFVCKNWSIHHGNGNLMSLWVLVWLTGTFKIGQKYQKWFLHTTTLPLVTKTAPLSISEKGNNYQKMETPSPVHPSPSTGVNEVDRDARDMRDIVNQVIALRKEDGRSLGHLSVMKEVRLAMEANRAFHRMGQRIRNRYLAMQKRV